jgi:hypothetical protein
MWRSSAFSSTAHTDQAPKDGYRSLDERIAIGKARAMNDKNRPQLEAAAVRKR